ncbi:CLUMA_CG000470, isoform A [Clunio marinus]|uniref:CLUMA_CG000470, isoform A n=1 Tax=Clunio marinus TaxID=568069 RepID=A0A1J1HGG2_9DIPT|nr:CLUMA_CG000470, isoform A [Clunio marinus]
MLNKTRRKKRDAFRDYEGHAKFTCNVALHKLMTSSQEDSEKKVKTKNHDENISVSRLMYHLKT